MIQLGSTARVRVDPNGASITSIIGSDGQELLAAGNAPEKLDHSHPSLVAAGLCGWIDCFPTIEEEVLLAGESSTPLQLSSHGELWWRRWDVVRLSKSDVEMNITIPELGVTCTRSISVGADDVSVVSIVRNTSPKELSFVWASHPLFAVQDDSRLLLPDQPVDLWPETSQSGMLGDFWPAADGDRRVWASIPSGSAVKMFLPWPPEGVQFTSHGRMRHMSFTASDDSLPLRLGLWINENGFPAHAPLRHMAIEPTVGSADSLLTSVRRGSAGRLAGRDEVRLEVVLTSQSANL